MYKYIITYSGDISGKEAQAFKNVFSELISGNKNAIMIPQSLKDKIKLYKIKIEEPEQLESENYIKIKDKWYKEYRGIKAYRDFLKLK